MQPSQINSEPPDAQDDKVGIVVAERYRIVRKLGEGGMGTVYEAEHILIGRKVALKCLLPEFSKETEVVERFKREARAATAAGNEHIIDVTDMGALPDGAPFIVMEYLAGREFADLMRTGPMQVGRAVRIVCQVCEALAAAHDKGIVHRDLKPENIFLVERKGDPDFVKVLDFGISKMREKAEKLDRPLTRTGMAMGTPHYMSPEQVQGSGVDHRTDIYALGVILYEALSGEPPFDAESFPMLMVQIMTTEAPQLKSKRPDLPDALCEVVHRALASDSAERFQTVSELAQALAPFVDDASEPKSRTTLGAGSPGASGASSGVRTRGQTAFANTDRPPPPDGRGSAVPTAKHAATGKKRVSAIVPMAVGAVLAVLAAAGAMIFLNGEDTGASKAAELAAVPKAAVPAPQPSPPVAPQPTAVAAPAQGAPTEVRIRITARPGDARIFIGDVEFPNPMDAARPRSLDPLPIRIEREGYRTLNRKAIFDADKSFAFELAAAAEAKAATPASTGRRRRRSPRSVSRGQASPESTKPAATPSKPASDGVYRKSDRRFRDDF